jgi:Na+/pantothenate symporter
MYAVLHWLDYLSLTAYFVAVVGFGIWTIIPKSNRDNVGGYFLASKTMHFIPLGASLFASNIGSGHLIGIHIFCVPYFPKNFASNEIFKD